MTQPAQLDFTRAAQRGLVIGLNEFPGYLGAALAGVAPGYLAAALGPREGLLWFGAAVIGLATLLSWLAVAETLPWARDEVKRHASAAATSLRPRYPAGVSPRPSTGEMFALSWRDRRMAALCQAGLVEKFVDALVWALAGLPAQRGVDLPGIGWIVGVTASPGARRSSSPALSDRLGRHLLNAWGMWICGALSRWMPLGSALPEHVGRSGRAGHGDVVSEPQRRRATSRT